MIITHLVSEVIVNNDCVYHKNKRDGINIPNEFINCVGCDSYHRVLIEVPGITIGPVCGTCLDQMSRLISKEILRDCHE